MGRHAGVLAFRAGRVALVRQSFGQSDHWSLPSGGVEEGESAPCGAARELREEAGLDVGPGSLEPAWTASVSSSDGSRNSQTWGFTVEVSASAGALAPADPDEAVLEAAW